MEFDSFLIQFDALKLGEHEYRFLLDDSFFKDLEYSEIQEGRVVVEAVMRKSERLQNWDLNFHGNVTIACDRCGDEFSAEIDVDESLVIRYGPEEDEDAGFMVLKQTAYEFDISHYLFETVNLCLPTRRIHPEVEGKPGCDETVLSYLTDEDTESKDDSKDEDDIDPRWAALKKLK